MTQNVNHYEDSSYITGNYSFEAVKKPGDILRTVEGLVTPKAFVTGIIDANETYQFSIDGDYIIKSIWVTYASTPSGNIQMKILNEINSTLWDVTLNVQQGNLGNAFVWEFPFMCVRNDYIGQFKPSIAVTGMTVWGIPCAILTNTVGIKI